MIAVRLEDSIVEEIDFVAEQESRTRSGIIREAIVRFFEDRADTKMATRAKTIMKSSKSLLKLRKELGLVH